LYVILIVLLAWPLIKPIGIKLDISDETRRCYEAIESLEPGSVVVFGFDYSAGNKAEMEPQALAVLRHLLRRNVKVIGLAFVEQGPILGEQAFQKTGWTEKQYGVDYINLGYRAGGQGTVAAFANDIPGTFNTDISGKPSTSFPIMEGIKTAADIDLIVTIAPGTPGPEDYVRQVFSSYQTPLVCGVPAVAITQVAPYVQAKQIKGILGGSPAAAQYELLIEQPGDAVAAMDAQSLAHLLIVAVIILRNIGYLAEKKASNNTANPSGRGTHS